MNVNIFTKKVLFVCIIAFTVFLFGSMYSTIANVGFLSTLRYSGAFLSNNRSHRNNSTHECPYNAYIKNKYLKINFYSACESTSIEIYNKQNILIFQSDKKVQKEIVINTMHWEKNEYRIDIINDFKTYTGTFNVD